jgi:hypothetical protein
MTPGHRKELGTVPVAARRDAPGIEAAARAWGLAGHDRHGSGDLICVRD